MAARIFIFLGEKCDMFIVNELHAILKFISISERSLDSFCCLASSFVDEPNKWF